MRISIVGGGIAGLTLAALSVSYRTLTMLSQKEQLPREKA